MADNEGQIIGYIEKTDKARVVISIQEWNNDIYVDIREFYHIRGTSEFKPGRKGLRFCIDRLEEILDIFGKIVV